MDLLLQIIVNILITGSLYGMVAMSFSLAYRATRFFNLAHGSMAAVGGYAFLWLHHELGVGFLISLPAAVLVAGLTGFLVDYFIYRPQRGRKASSSVFLVISLGVVTIIEASLAMIFGTQFRPLVSTGAIQPHQIAGIFITSAQLWIIAVNILMFGGLLVLLYKTRFGRMIRAISDDPEVARVLGIRTDYYLAWIFFISAALAGLTGILAGMDTGLQPTIGFYLLLKGVVAAIIGCVASVPGALLGAFILAAAENTGVWFFDSEWRDAIAFVLLLVFLVFRPQGILGKRRD